MRTLYKILGTILLSIWIFSGCQENTSDPTSISSDQGSLSKGMIIHNVSVGSPDVDLIGPGGDANFSLVATISADGIVSGQWQDAFYGSSGIHVVVDCVIITGNTAVISGVITQGPDGLIGEHAACKVVDNGKSANDPPDQISPSYIYRDCNFNDFNLYDVTPGQVTVR